MTNTDSDTPAVGNDAAAHDELACDGCKWRDEQIVRLGRDLQSAEREIDYLQRCLEMAQQ